MGDLSTFTDGWFNHRHLGLIGSVVLASLLQFFLSRPHADSIPALRHNLVAGLLCLAASLLVHPFAMLGMKLSANLLDEVSTLALGLLLIRICGLTAFRVLLPAMRFTPPAILEDILLVLTYIAWGLVRLRAAGLDLAGLVTTSAVITGVIAFSMQETLGNILGGLALQLDNSVRIGDWISIDDVRGQVIEVHWRHTDVRTNNGHRIVIPNSVLMKSKVDVFSCGERPHFRRWLRFRISDSVPPQEVITPVTRALGEAQIANVASSPAPECIVTDYRDGWVEYAVRYWLVDPRHDDGTDSQVRVHFYSALRRQSFSLAHPCLEIQSSHCAPEQDAGLQQVQELQRRTDALARVKLFSILSAEEISRMALCLRPTPFVRNDVMTKQGAVAHWLYVLVQGEAEVWYQTEPSQPRTLLAILQPGEVFGERGLLTGEPRRATVIARTDAQCYRLDKDMFEQILQNRPELADEFARILSERDQELRALNAASAPTRQAEQASLLINIRRFFGLVRG
jgi:small-conductance mechanosensitive channel/CRP-like cAMP-binding protein